jgi:hypothetical protein
MLMIHKIEVQREFGGDAESLATKRLLNSAGRMAVSKNVNNRK